MSRKWYVPQLAKLPPATSLADVPIASSFIQFDVWKFHPEQWEIR